MMIQKNNVTEQIIAYYKQKILEGEWKVGGKVPSENQLSAELGVSRASIRSAVKELIGIGVLESIHGKGTYLIDNKLDFQNSSEYKITASDCQDIKKVLVFRRIIEPEACYLAAVNVTDAVLKELEEALQRMLDNRLDSLKYVAADLKFHRAISKATDNPLIEKSMNRVFDENFREHEAMNQLFGYDDGIHYHTLILEAMNSGDAVRAREVMFEHMQHAIDLLEKMGK